MLDLLIMQTVAKIRKFFASRWRLQPVNPGAYAKSGHGTAFESQVQNRFFCVLEQTCRSLMCAIALNIVLSGFSFGNYWWVFILRFFPTTALDILGVIRTSDFDLEDESRLTSNCKSRGVRRVLVSPLGTQWRAEHWSHPTI